MANSIYPKYKEALLLGSTGVNLVGGDAKLIAINAGLYTYSDTHDMLDDIPGGSRVSISASLSGKDVIDGFFFADQTEFTNVSGLQIDAFVLYLNTGVESTSRLVCYLDTGIGLPVTPTGGDIFVTPAVTGLFRL